MTLTVSEHVRDASPNATYFVDIFHGMSPTSCSGITAGLLVTDQHGDGSGEFSVTIASGDTVFSVADFGPNTFFSTPGVVLLP
jgi:hypothetical protein